MDIFKVIDDADLDGYLEPIEELKDCNICPRNCHANRYSDKLGYCKAGASFSISSIFSHRGEEPAISGENGICNIFFTNCNLQCTFCQNYQISCNQNDYQAEVMPFRDVLKQIVMILRTGVNHVGFVSPSHFVPQVKAIIRALRGMGLNPIFVYNTNGYDKPEVISGLAEYIDIYLPDYKYADGNLSKRYSDAADYPEVALASLREMYRQKGSSLPLMKGGYALKGMIIRHLVLPGHAENSIQVLRNIASELSNEIHISLMSQYYPTHRVVNDPDLSRTLRYKEYIQVVNELDRLGFSNGWVQEIDSQGIYRPDFEKDIPFE